MGGVYLFGFPSMPLIICIKVTDQYCCNKGNSSWGRRHRRGCGLLHWMSGCSHTEWCNSVKWSACYSAFFLYFSWSSWSPMHVISKFGGLLQSSCLWSSIELEAVCLWKLWAFSWLFRDKPSFCLGVSSARWTKVLAGWAFSKSRRSWTGLTSRRDFCWYRSWTRGYRLPRAQQSQGD